MAKGWGMGDCVRLPDGRIGRVRAKSGRQYRVRVRRATSATHQFLTMAAKDLKQADCLGLDRRERSEDTEEIVR